MDNSQVIEPVFRIIAVRPCPQREVLSPARVASLTKTLFFALLDRIGVCQVPRVLGVHCFAAEGLTAEAGMGE